MESLSDGVAELSDAGRSSKNVQRSLADLETVKGAYAEEVSRLKSLHDDIAEKSPPAKQPVCDSELSETESWQDLVLVKNLMKEREDFIEKINQQEARFNEIQQELEREHGEKVEAQICLSVLNETIKAALQSEKVLVEQNHRLVSDQKFLASKLELVSKSRFPASQSQFKELERTFSGMRHEESVLVLYNKAWIRGLCLFFELILFLHALLWIIRRTLKGRYNFVPT